MRRTAISILLLVLVCAAGASAAPWQTIGYQGFLRDSAGNVVPDDDYVLTFRLYEDGFTGFVLVWEETQTISVEGGFLNAYLGAVEPLDLPFDQQYWMGISVNGEPELSPYARLTTAPNAFRAKVAESLVGGVPADSDWLYSGDNIYRTEGNVGIGTSTPGQKLTVAGTMYAHSDTFGGKFYASHPSCQTHVVHAEYNGTPGSAIAVYGQSSSGDGMGIGGYFYGGGTGVQASASVPGTTDRIGVYGSAYGSSGTCYGVKAHAQGSGTNYGIHSTSYGGATNYAGYFNGNVQVAGTLTKSSGAFRIDHPLDPANKYLQHSFVESPDMKNIYDGVVSLGSSGEAWVVLPKWFEALNRDFRYQLTPIGAPAPNLHVADVITDGRFRIAGGEPGMDVSWMVTGIRRDPYAEAHPIEVELEKPAGEQGLYIHPELYGLPREAAIASDPTDVEP